MTQQITNGKKTRKTPAESAHEAAQAIRKLAELSIDGFAVDYPRCATLPRFKARAMPELIGEDGKLALWRLIMAYNVSDDMVMVLNPRTIKGTGTTVTIAAIPRSWLQPNGAAAH